MASQWDRHNHHVRRILKLGIKVDKFNVLTVRLLIFAPSGNTQFILQINIKSRSSKNVESAKEFTVIIVSLVMVVITLIITMQEAIQVVEQVLVIIDFSATAKPTFTLLSFYLLVKLESNGNIDDKVVI